MTKTQKFGYVAIIGEPNVGKSTLMNALIETKLSIVTPKVQTTRFRIQGFCMDESAGAQMVIVDTPGLFAAKSKLEKAMVKSAQDGFSDADIAVFLFDLSRPNDMNLAAHLDGAKKSGARRVYVLNKSDLAKPEDVNKACEKIRDYDANADIHSVSALKQSGVAELRKHLMGLLPDGPWHYDPEHLTDMPERMIAAEITREQVFLQLSHEVPYGCYVETEAWQDFDNGSVKITQNIIVSRETHKPIVLGKAGSRIKQIREAAQKEMQKSFARAVHLFLFVKVREDWTENRAFYRDMGLDFGG